MNSFLLILNIGIRKYFLAFNLGAQLREAQIWYTVVDFDLYQPLAGNGFLKWELESLIMFKDFKLFCNF